MPVDLIQLLDRANDWVGRGRQPRTREKFEADFWARVNRSEGCWEWRGALDERGYGRTQIGRQRLYAHRVAYVLAFGTDPGPSQVCHRCDNPACVRPDHLWLGDLPANMADMVAKDRQAKGTKNGSARLTEQEVADIRHLQRAGAGMRELARSYRVSLKAIQKIVNRETWQHVS